MIKKYAVCIKYTYKLYNRIKEKSYYFGKDEYRVDNDGQLSQSLLTKYGFSRKRDALRACEDHLLLTQFDQCTRWEAVVFAVDSNNNPL